MINTLLGTKKKMTQAFVDSVRTPVTVVSVAPNIVTQIATDDHNGYWGVQLAEGTRKAKNTSKSLQGHFKKSKALDDKNKTFPRHIREVRMSGEPEEKVGDTLSVADVFSAGDTVAVTGVSKGKGFAGGVKRHGFAGGPKTHGQSDRHRAPGSIGQGTSPGRVWKGKRMAGRMGSDTITIKNLKVVKVDSENNELHLSGPVPGTAETLLMIKRTSLMQDPPSLEATEGQGKENQNES